MACNRPGGNGGGWGGVGRSCGWTHGSLDNKCKSTYGANWGEDGWRGGGWNAGGACHESDGYCKINAAHDDLKYACCTDNPIKHDVLHCSQNWCQGQETCTNYFKNTHCVKGDNMITDDICFSNSNYLDKAKAGEICSRIENFNLPNCKTFCANEVTGRTANAGTCLRSAGTYCALKQNFYDPECACINYNATDDFKDNIQKFSELKKTNYQCWATTCATSSDWASLHRSTSTVDCPQQLTICNQQMVLTDIKAQSLGSISQSCDSNQGKSTTNLTLPPGPSSAPDPVVSSVAAAVAAATAKPAKPTKSASGSSSRLLQIGGGGVSFFCSILSSLLLILLFFMMK